MCTYNFSLDDILIERVKPAFRDDSSIHNWMQKQLENALEKLAVSLPAKEEKKVMLSQRLRGIAKVSNDFDYKKELENRY